MDKTKGKFIIFEGVDTCGKGSQIELLKKDFGMTSEQYIDHDKKIYFTREPGGMGIPLAEQLRKIILEKNNKIDAITEAYLYATSRSLHTAQIEKYIEEGYLVFCERYIYSSFIYQGIGRKLGITDVLYLNFLALRNLKPDMIFYLEIDLNTYLERISEKKYLDRIEMEDTTFFKEIIENYNLFFEKKFPILSKEENSKLYFLDGKKDINSLHKKIKTIINNDLGGINI